MVVVEAHDEEVGTGEEEGVRAQLERSARRGRAGLEPGVVRQQAHVELLDGEAAHESVGGKGEAVPQILAKVERHEVEQRIEEVPGAEVAAAVVRELAGRQ